MDVRQPIREAVNNRRKPKFLSVSFNQDDSCFSVALENGFRIFNTDPLANKLSKTFQESSGNQSRGTGIGYTRMLYRTNYIALVGGGKRPRHALNKLIIWDDLLQKETITLKFMSSIRDVYLSRIHIVIVLENTIEIFEFQTNPRRICPILDIPSNGSVDYVVCTNKHLQSQAFSQSQSKIVEIITFPSTKCMGQIQVADLSQIKHNSQNPTESALLPTSIIKAHKNQIKLVRLNHQGTMVATCSVQGTLIRIFSTHNGSLIKEFRRGMEKADIYEMSFSPNGSKLAALSNKQTLHIFQIFETNNTESNSHNHKHENGTGHLLTNYIPKGLWRPKYLDSVWSICNVHLKNPIFDAHRSANNGDATQGNEFYKDRCKIGWCRDANNQDQDDSLVLVWQNSGIWEKFVILEKEQEDSSKKRYSLNESLRNDDSKQMPEPTRWELVRESWREL
ncbi:hsv2p [Saccharomyces arboricola H-6]|uniref:Hsv2p n=1 Tax=Saccharomyces arboricola (strain H-6 / AS 2.3317 / CBS 10644) TaxID=1160507 RepID=J8Q1R3_SACAR|nr:hsv2p [Saccharomyces arboricola H-6]